MNGTIFRVDRECFLVPVLPAVSGVTIMVTVEEYRLDKDSMGEVKVPSSAYYGAETQRAVQNFPISGLRLPKEFVRAMALIKLSAARPTCSWDCWTRRRARLSSPRPRR